MSDLVQRIESLRIKAAANRGGVTSITVEELTDILAALEDAERYQTAVALASKGMLPEAWKEGYTPNECTKAIDQARRRG